MAAGLGWGVAAGLALGVLVIAPAMRGEADPGAAARPEEVGADQGAGASNAEAEAAAANGLIARESEAIVGGSLEGDSVVVLRADGVPEEDVSKQRWLLERAGALNAGTITLTEKFTSQDAADELSTVITNSLPGGAQISVDNRSPGVHAGEALAAALTTAGDADRQFLLTALQDAGFIEGADSVTGAADAMVLITGGDHTAFGQRVLEDFGGAISDSGTPFAADSSSTEAGRVGAVVDLRDAINERG